MLKTVGTRNKKTKLTHDSIWNEYLEQIKYKFKVQINWEVLKRRKHEGTSSLMSCSADIFQNCNLWVSRSTECQELRDNTKVKKAGTWPPVRFTFWSFNIGPWDNWRRIWGFIDRSNESDPCWTGSIRLWLDGWRTQDTTSTLMQIWWSRALWAAIFKDDLIGPLWVEDELKIKS